MSVSQLWRRSLSWRLVFYVLVPALCLLALAGSVTAYRVEHSVNQLFDRQLVHSADILLAVLEHERAEEQDDDEPDDDSDDRDDPEEQNEERDELVAEIGTLATELKQRYQLEVQYRIYLNQTLILSTDSIKAFARCQAGFSDITPQGKHHNKRWRCYKGTLQDANNLMSIEVEFFEDLSVRRQSIHKLTLSTLTPFMLLPIAIVGMVFWAVRRGLKPVLRVSTEIGSRSVHNLQPLSEQDLPRELTPVVQAVNALLTGIKQGMAREKQFSDDAAHELRTPLTSMSMLEQLLRRDNRDPKLMQHLDALRQSLAKSRHLVDQLLLFARLQSAHSLPREPLCLQELLNTQLGDFSTQLTDKQLSVSLALGEPVSLSANRDAMGLLLGNILGNAIKFSPQGGTLYLIGDQQQLRIEDDGPGVETAERQRVFERFYRSNKTRHYAGSGLGLSLAAWMATQHQYELRCVAPQNGQGGAFLLRF